MSARYIPPGGGESNTGGDWFAQQGAPPGGAGAASAMTGPVPVGGAWRGAFGTFGGGGTLEQLTAQIASQMRGAQPGAGLAFGQRSGQPDAWRLDPSTGQAVPVSGDPRALIGDGTTFGITDPGQGGRIPTAGQTATGGADGGGADTSWWNPQDPRGSINALFGGQPPSSQTILAHAPQLQAAGIQISPPNAEGVTSKINIPGVGWTRILEGGTAGGQGTGWNYVPQGVGAGAGGAGGGSPYGVLGGGTTPLSDLAAGPNPIFDLANQAASGLAESPGYQFRLQQGQQALERSAAAKGTLLTGGTAKALDRYGQDFASTEYGNRLNQLLGMQGTRFNQLSGEQGQRANQLMGLGQLGLNAAGTQANLGNSYAGQAGNILTNQAANLGSNITGAGNAASAGTVASGNAWQQGLSGVGNGASQAAQMYYLSQLLGGGGGGGTVKVPYPGYGVLQNPPGK